MELTNNIRKSFKSLDERKYRKRLGLFKCEGTKCVTDTVDHFEPYAVVATRRWIDEHPDLAERFERYDLTAVTATEIKQMSSLTTPQEIIAIYRLPEREFDAEAATQRLVVALDGVQDPGNLGTIIRTCDWFGITDLVCSRATADAFAPKVIQATMGAISRVRVCYTDLEPLIGSLIDKGVPVYGTFLDGESIYTRELSANGLIVMGNEGNGISSAIAEMIGRRLLIPSFTAPGFETSESLNVATATAITVSEFRRRMMAANPPK